MCKLGLLGLVQSRHPPTRLETLMWNLRPPPPRAPRDSTVQCRSFEYASGSSQLSIPYGHPSSRMETPLWNLWGPERFHSAISGVVCLRQPPISFIPLTHWVGYPAVESPEPLDAILCNILCVGVRRSCSMSYFIRSHPPHRNLTL